MLLYRNVPAIKRDNYEDTLPTSRYSKYVSLAIRQECKPHSLIMSVKVEEEKNAKYSV